MEGTDNELFSAWCAGEAEAGDRLLRRHFRALFSFFSSKVEEGAEDLIQRTMLACVRGRENYRAEGSFRGYLFGVARHELYAHYRRKRSGPTIDFGVTSVRDLAPSARSVVVAKKEQQMLLAALRELPLDLQIAVELHYWEELSTKELAQALGIAQGTVKSRLRRAREALAERLQDRQSRLEDLSTDRIDDWVRSVRAEARFASDDTSWDED